ncbi:MAG: sigma-70 family RNA polymerase sigma factor [bacterium]
MPSKSPITDKRGNPVGLNTEMTLIPRAQKGDKQAFKQIVNMYQHRVLKVAHSLVGNSHDAHDVTQEVFIRLYRFLPRFNHNKRFFTWLYRIIVNASYDFLKKENRFRTVPLDHISETNYSMNNPQTMHQKEIKGKIYELLEALTTLQKTAFILRDVEGFSCKETAKIMKSSSGTIRSHLSYARARLRKLLKKYYPELLEGIVE